MKLKTFAISIALLALSPITALSDDGEARLQLIDKEADMGGMDEGEIKTDTVRFANTGTAALHISSVFSSCRCTYAKATQEIIAPGDTAQLIVTFNAKGRSPGEFRKVIRIRSNATNSNQPMVVKGRVRRPDRRPLSRYE